MGRRTSGEGYIRKITTNGKTVFQCVIQTKDSFGKKS